MDMSSYDAPIDSQKLLTIAAYFDEVFRFPKCHFTTQQILSEPLTNPRQHTIHMDAIRTRAKLYTAEQAKASSLVLDPHSQQTQKNPFASKKRAELQSMLTHYCRHKNIQYKQGLNQLMAPFAFLTSESVPLEKCYALFDCFFTRYCFNFYFEKEFQSMEVMFKMVQLVLRYHQPQLARYLKVNEIPTQVFCVAWLLTLFSNKLSLEIIYNLWMFIATEHDKFFVFFIVVAIIIYRKDNIIRTSTQSIYSVVMDLIFKDMQELNQIITIALLLRKTTPSSLLIFFKQKDIFTPGKSQQLQKLMKSIQEIQLFLVLPHEISLKQHFKFGMCETKECYFCALHKPLSAINHLHRIQKHFPDLSKLVQLSCDIRTMDQNIQFVILDLRAQSAVEWNQSQNRLKRMSKQMYKINISQDICRIQQQFIQRFMLSRGTQHFIFLLTSFSFEDNSSANAKELTLAKTLIQSLNSYSFPYLSILQGGYQSFCHYQHMLRSLLLPKSSELIPQTQQLPLAVISRRMKPSEVMLLQQLYKEEGLQMYSGGSLTKELTMLTTDDAVIFVETNEGLVRLWNIFTSTTSILTECIRRPEIINVEMKIVKVIPTLAMRRIAVEMHKTNMLVIKHKGYATVEGMSLKEVLTMREQERKSVENNEREQVQDKVDNGQGNSKDIDSLEKKQEGNKQEIKINKEKINKQEIKINKEEIKEKFRDVFDAQTLEQAKKIAKTLKDLYVRAVKKKRQKIAHQTKRQNLQESNVIKINTV